MHERLRGWDVDRFLESVKRHLPALTPQVYISLLLKGLYIKHHTLFEVSFDFGKHLRNFNDKTSFERLFMGLESKDFKTFPN